MIMKALLTVTITLLIISDATFGTLSPPKEQTNKKGKSKVDVKKGSVNQDVFERGLVVKDPKSIDILRSSNTYYKDTKRRRFHGNVLGYITPWNEKGLEISKTFHGKFTAFSPVWLTIPYGNTSEFSPGTHDVRKDWIKEIRKQNSANHTTKIIPRVFFENWIAEDIIALQTNSDKRIRLISALIDTAKNFRFDGYVLEIWNQFIFTGVDARVVIFIIKSIAKKLNNHNLSVILAVPPIRGMKVELFHRAHFDELAQDVESFSLMTYDYSSVQRPGPNSPLEWARHCIKELVPNDDDPRRSQILLGINFYGNSYTPEGGGPILGSQYLEMLDSFKGKIQWDDRSKEHFFETKTAAGSSFVFYPTLYSLNKRIELASELGTGISIWELGQGLNYFYDLL
ncbi:chitinase domain-containing protein 1 [Cephus cinctus]|uniref:Chitinase domain-containing protein 1 n=1 Tax=Cephus cinctus TaxID=211228 RepID=A0AAJ7BRY5_CEPCN|nr:chitinase domain-containing protein 1 [Cephus cinctus]